MYYIKRICYKSFKHESLDQFSVSLSSNMPFLELPDKMDIYKMREELRHMMKSKAFTKPREYMIAAVKQFKVSKRGRTRINGQKKQKGSCQPKIRKTFQTIRIGKQGNGATT